METSSLRPGRVRLLGEPVDLITAPELMRFVGDAIASGRRAVIANHNLHSLYLLRRRPEMRAFYAMADLVELDSTPLVAWGRLLGLPISRAHRLTYLDWREQFWTEAHQRGWRVFYLGGSPGVAETAAARLSARYPGAAIGCRDGYFAPGDNDAVVEAISAFRPDILFVGMGMPRQELWIAANADRLERGVVFSVGAAFDYEAGVQRSAPRWLGRVGLEWAFRLVTSPARLAARYLVEPWWLIPAAARDVLAALARRGQSSPYSSENGSSAPPSMAETFTPG